MVLTDHNILFSNFLKWKTKINLYLLTGAKRKRSKKKKKKERKHKKKSSKRLDIMLLDFYFNCYCVTVKDWLLFTKYIVHFFTIYSKKNKKKKSKKNKKKKETESSASESEEEEPMWLEKTGKEREINRGEGERGREKTWLGIFREREERERVFVMGFKELLHCRNM